MMLMKDWFQSLELEGFIFIFIRVSNLSDDLNKIFTCLRLKEINSGVFLKMDPKLSKTLKTIESYVTFGYKKLNYK